MAFRASAIQSLTRGRRRRRRDAPRARRPARVGPHGVRRRSSTRTGARSRGWRSAARRGSPSSARRRSCACFGRRRPRRRIRPTRCARLAELLAGAGVARARGRLMRRREPIEPRGAGAARGGPRAPSGAAGSSSALVGGARPGAQRAARGRWSATSAAALVLVAARARGAVRCRRSRRWLLRALRAARVRRAWWRAWTDCELPRVRAGRVIDDPGRRAGPGAGVARVVAGARRARAPRSWRCACRRARSGSRATRTTPRRGTVTLVRRDPLAGMVSVPWPHRDAERAVAVGADPGRRRRARRDGHGRAARAQRADGRRAGRGQERRAVDAGRDRRRSTRRAAVAARRQAGRAVGVGAVRAAARRPGRRRGDRAAARAARRRWRRATASCSPAASARSRARTGCRCTWWRATSWRSTSAARTARSRREFAELLRDLVARGRAAGVIVCAATQKPASDVVPTRAAGSVRVPAGAALQHAAGLGHDPRPGLGDARAQRGDDRARAARRRAAAGRGRHAGPDARLPPRPTTTSTSSPRAPPRCAPTAGWRPKERAS